MTFDTRDYATLAPLFSGIEIRPGDFGSVVSNNWEGQWSERLFNPPTRELHYFLFGEYRENLCDWVLLESITSKGASTSLLLKHHQGMTINVYRHNSPDIVLLSDDVVDQFYLLSRSRYNYGMMAQFFWQCVTSGSPRWEPTMFKYSESPYKWCTELVNKCHELAGVPIINFSNASGLVRPDPWSFMIARELGVYSKLGALNIARSR